MHLFLYGGSMIGKTSLLKSVLSPYEKWLCGFSTGRIYEGERLLGFRVSVSGESVFVPDAQFGQDMSGVFLLDKHWNIAVLESAIRRARSAWEAGDKKLVLLDEIGGIELASTVFMEHLLWLLAHARCAGVLKSEQNLRRMAQKHALESHFFDNRSCLERLLSQKGILLELSTDNAAAAAQTMQRFAAEVFG